MLDSFVLLSAMRGIRDEYVLDTMEWLGLMDEKPQQRRPSKILATVLIAAALMLLLAACGYAVYRATMAHRELNPKDAMTYYYNGPAGPNSPEIHLELNHGTCALAVQFNTEAVGAANAFRWKNPSLYSDGWTQRTSLFDLFQILSYDPDYFAQPACTTEEALEQSGLTEEEAKAASIVGTYTWEDDSGCKSVNILLKDGPQLFETDQIFGWPKGTSEIVREDTWGEFQRLEVIITREMGEDNHEVDKYLLLFHPVEQYLIYFSTPDETVSFTEMEALAEELEVIKTGFRYSLEKSATNWSIADYGAG